MWPIESRSTVNAVIVLFSTADLNISVTFSGVTGLAGSSLNSPVYVVTTLPLLKIVKLRWMDTHSRFKTVFPQDFSVFSCLQEIIFWHFC